MKRTEDLHLLSFWGRWVAATLLSLLAGMVLFILVGAVAGEALDAGPPALFGLVLGAIFGTSFGIGHALVLKRKIGGAGAWIIATGIAFVVAACVIFGFLQGSSSDTSLLIKLTHALVLGGSLGLAQYMVLERQVTGAAAWIVISIVAWSIAELVAAFIGPLVGPPLDILLLFFIGGALPGIGIPWLLRRPVSSHEEVS